MTRQSLTIVAILLLALPAWSQVPRTLSVQGVLTDADGAPLPDGTYYGSILLYTVPEGGSHIWEESDEFVQTDGVFNLTVGLEENLDPAFFDQELYLEIDMGAEPAMEPRIRLTTSPYAFRAAVADSVIGGGGADGDWVIQGDDLYHLLGRIYVGVSPDAVPRATRDEAGGLQDREPLTSKLTVIGLNEGFFSQMAESNTDADERSAVYGLRTRTTRNDGSGFAVYQTNTAMTGYNLWGDSYTFGMAGYTWFDFAHTAGVLGSKYDGSVWGALGYQDDAYASWGFYSPNNIKVGGVAVLEGLFMGNGASPGYVLTSDNTGNASWQPPTGGADSDWIIYGDDLYHDSDGTVAVGTNNPTPVFDGQTTLQIESGVWPGIALDRRSSFHRWAIFNEGFNRQLQFGATDTPGGIPSVQFALTEDGRLALGGTLPWAELNLAGGAGDVESSSGAIRVGSGDHSFRLGVYTSGPEAGEVNLWARSNDSSGRLDLGVADHDLVSLHDYQTDFLNSSGDVMVNISTDGVDAMGGHFTMSSTTYPWPIIRLMAQPEAGGGGASVDLNQENGENGIFMRAQDPDDGGGKITLYNSSGNATLILDGHRGVGNSRVTTDALEITGGADLSEQFDLGETGTEALPGMVVSIDPDRPGRLTLSQNAYDRRVAGVISGAGGVKTGMLMGQDGSVADGEMPVALAGRVYVLADASEGAIESGDLLTTSNISGHAMRVSDYSRAGGAILGKAMTGLRNGRGLVLVLVTLQ